MANFCTNCGTKIRKEDNFCINCGTKIDKSYINLSKSSDNIEKEKIIIANEKQQEKVRIAKEKEMINNETKMIENGGYCDLSCIHCYEEYLDSDGEIVGDFDSGGIYEYYCNLGHYVSYGSFCEDYE